MSKEEFLRALEDLIDAYAEENDDADEDLTIKLLRHLITENLKQLELRKER